MTSRTEHTVQNSIFALVTQLVNIIIKFVVRTIFIKTLGSEYLGIAGVFNNVLAVLSLAELGIGTAIVYDMYKPIAEDDKTRITQLYLFYKKIYFMIGAVIFVLGLTLLPFLKYLLTDVSTVQHIKFIYILHLLDSVSTYFFAHCRALVNAQQLNRLNSKNNLFISLLKTVLEIVVLLVAHSYILYMIVQIGVNILGNYLISLKVNKLFPYVRDSVPRLEKSYKISVFRNAMHMLLIRIGATLINSTDNLIISALISTVLVGIYSNYSMIVQIILTTVFLVETAMSASVGNLCANSSCQRKYEIFLRIRFLYTCMFCFISVCLYVLLNPFVEMWIGQQYLLSKTTVLLIVINCYLSGIRQPIEVYITADGLFRHFTLKPLVEVVINLVISIVGARLYGINGVLLGTTISHVATTLWFDAFVVYKYSFKEKLSKYFLLLLKGGCCTALIMGLADGVVNCIGMKGVKGFIISICVCIISSVFVLPFYSRNNEFKWWVKMIKRN